MKRIVLFISLALLNYTNLQAQYPNLIYSEKTPEIAGNFRVKQLKNGNTAVFNFTKDDGIHFSLYDANKKKIIDEKLKLTYLKYELKYYRIRCILEINNDIMFMFEGLPRPEPTLYRVLIDGSTGKVKKEDEVTKVNVSEGKKASAVLDYTFPTKTFWVTKDPKSDYYAIVVFNKDADDRNKRIEVIHFNPSHIQLNRAFFQSPNGQYKFLNYSDVYVSGENYVILSAYVYNTKASSSTGQEESVFYFSKLSKGSTTFKNHELTYTNSNVKSHKFTQATCKFAFDKASNILYAAVDTYSNFDKRTGSYVYDFFIQPLNPDNMEMRKAFPIPLEKANNYYQTKLESKKEYTGMLQSFLIDRTTGHIILLNEMPITISGEGGISTELRDPAITDMTIDGKENYAIVIPYNHWTFTTEASFNYLHNKNGNLHHTTVDEFNTTYVDAVAGEKYNYLFLNNTLLNYDKPDNDKGFEKRVRTGMDGLSSVIYKIDKQGNMSKGLLFGNSPVKNGVKYCLFNSADFNPETNTYAAIVIERSKAGKTTSVVWLTLE
jgi:hypothetical protein